MRGADPPSPLPAPLPRPPSSSPLPLCPELDLSVSHSPAPKPRPAAPKPRPHRHTEAKRHRQVHFEEPLVVTVTAEPRDLPSNGLPPRQQARSPKRRGRHHGNQGRGRGQGAGPPAAAATEESGCLEGAELNTSLALRAELVNLQGAEFNSQKAVQETLRKSQRTKNLINSKATEGLNVSRSQQLYSSLVSVQLEAELVISRALQERLQLAPPPCCHDNKPADGPSPLLFLTSDLQRQKPLPPEEPSSSKPRPLPRPAHFTFDLYRRQRRWQSTP